jgi:hypothetical protein
MLQNFSELEQTRAMCAADPKGSATLSQGIHGYIYVMATVRITYF